MQYTLFEHGRPIGEADLELATPGSLMRMGWFHPNALGETLMPVIGAVLPTLCALNRYEDDALRGGEPDPEKRWRESAEFADWREAVHHVEQLALELRRADGVVIPTRYISIQDTEALLELARNERATPGEIWDDDVDLFAFDDELLDGVEHMAETETDLVMPGEWEGDGEVIDGTPFDEDAPAMGRYQIFVTLLDDGAVP